jgi:hypothetical protein
VALIIADAGRQAFIMLVTLIVRSAAIVMVNTATEDNASIHVAQIKWVEAE